MLEQAKRMLSGLAGKSVLAAVSGGMDSMCLLHLLHTWGRQQGIDVTAAHFNHQLRGTASDGDEAFVRSWCADNGVPFVCGREDVRGLAEREKLSMEEAARKARYAFLRQAAVSLAGPLMNLLCFFLCLPLPRAYCAIQLCLFLFHILPAVPLDGGTALYCALCSVLSEKNASRWCVGISVTLSFLLGVLGFSILLRSKGNFTLLAVAVYILFYLLMKQREDLY